MSDWINFVKDFSKMNNIPYSAALTEAKPYYDKYRKQKFINEMPHYQRTYGQEENNKYVKMAEDLLGYGGEEAQKGALAALLTGLDAQIKIK